MNTETFKFWPLLESDYPQINEIYLQGIATKNATFQTEGKSWNEWNSGLLPSCRIGVKRGDSLMGWAALSPVSSRCVYYSGVAEVSIYVRDDEKGQGLGFELLKELVKLSESAGIWTLQGGIFAENQASIAIHKKCGFREVGIREKLGKMEGVWRDVVLMERRSLKI